MELQDVLQHFESKADLARALGVSRQTVNYWRTCGKIPAEHRLRLKYEVLPKIEAKTSQKDAQCA